MPLLGAALALLAGVATAAFVLWPAAPSISASGDRGRADVSLPEPVEPAFVPPEPLGLGTDTHVSLWAPVLRSVVARTQPGAGDVVATLDDVTPEGTTNIASVVESAPAEGSVWVRVRLATLPNNLTGWVPRSALGDYEIVRTHLVVDLADLTATLYRNGRAVFRARVGVGKAQWPTPTGTFYVRNKLTSFTNAAYGPLAFGTSARSDVLTDWPAGGFIGIHGTDRPELLPGRVSHGCIRMRNPDILRLARLMPVGTPLTVT